MEVIEMKKFIAAGIAGAALLAYALPALGHGMGAGPAAIDPESDQSPVTTGNRCSNS